MGSSPMRDPTLTDAGAVQPKAQGATGAGLYSPTLRSWRNW